MFFLQESTLGEQTTRLILFHPWPTALGVSSLAVGLISLCVQDRRWRWAGLAGALVGVVFSWSRLAMGAAVLLAATLLVLRTPNWLKLLAITLGLAALWALMAAGIDPLSMVGDARAAADGARSGSSLARALIYEKSWEGFLQSPWIGHGWVGESVHPVENLPIGSHSTIYGLLYTGGIITFGCFALAMALTLAAIVRSMWRASGTPSRRNADIAFCLWLVLLLTATYESIYSLTLPCLALFAWIGGVIEASEPADPLDHAQRVPHAPRMREAMRFGAETTST
jgi:O-antigen ligase